MADTTFEAGVLNDDQHILYSVPSPFPPFLSGHGVYAREFVVNTDFPSGNDVVIEFEGSDTLPFAKAVDNTGKEVAYTEAASSGGTGRKLTFAAVTTNLKVFVVYSI